VEADLGRVRVDFLGVVLSDSRLDPGLSGLSQEDAERLCLRNELASANVRISFKDRDGRFVLVSAGWLNAYAEGRPLEDVIGRTHSEFFNESHAAAARDEDRRVLATGEAVGVRIEHETFDDRPDAWVQVLRMPLHDEDNNVVGTWSIINDITAQVRAEQALAVSREELASSERMHRAMFEHNPQPMWLYDRESFQVVAVNEAAQVVYGYSREEFLTLSVLDLLPPEDGHAFVSEMTVPEGEQSGLRISMPRRHRYKDGTIVDVEVTANDVLLDGRACRIALSQDVTERNRAAAELAAARDAAVEASNTKSAFLANISHEVRTPMNGVLGMTQLLLDSELDADQRSLAEHLASSGELMVALINDILDISKIEAGQLQLELNDFSLRESIAKACAVAQPQAMAKGLDLVQELDAALPALSRGDGRRLYQILLNLIVNAVKFTSEGKIVVRAAVEAQHGAASAVRVEVVDTGIGIEPSLIGNMFEPFTQADASTTRKYGGTGLGLAISRELIGLMGGTIGATSEPGCGSTFWIELLLHEPATTAAGAPASVDGDGAAKPQWSTAPLVLVVEDSQVNQIVVVRTLERCGCRTDVANTGLEALEMLAKQRYDAVLMDCQMPEMDGYEATAALRARENGGPRTPVIAMTAHAMHGDRERCLDAGMDDYLSKPIRRDWLIDTLRRWLPVTSDDATMMGTERVAQ
jgi:PAS domain S-box-containing protein